MNKAARKRTIGWLGHYTLVYVLGMAALCALLAYCKKTLMWIPDGISQPYTMLGYVGQMARDVLHGKGVPMLSFSLGQGLDVMTTCSFYGYTDPLLLLGVFFQGRSLETGYMLIAMLRGYLGGAFMGVYLGKVGVRHDWTRASAALIYAFSGYFIHMLGFHVHFLNGAMFLPLMLLGVERILNRDGWLMYVFVTALMLIVNFYFAYMNTIAAIVYILIRLAARLRAQGVHACARDGFVLLGGYLLAVALSAVVFLPIVRVYLINSRYGVAAGYMGSMLHYGKKYYIDLVTDAFAPWRNPGLTTLLNLSPLAFVGIVAAVVAPRRASRQALAGLVLCGIVLCVPWLGNLMNGGAYVSNRWCYIAVAVVAICAALGLDGLFKRRRLAHVWTALAALLFAAALAVYYVRTRQKWMLMAPCLLGALGILLLLYHGARVKALTPQRMRAAFTLLLAVNCLAYTVIAYAPFGYHYADEAVDQDAYTAVSSAAVAQLIDDDGVYRVDQNRYDDAHALLLDYHGTSFYWSLVDSELSDYYRQLYLPMQTNSYHLFGLGGGATVNAVAAVKYKVQQEGAKWVMPDGFEAAQTVSLPDGTQAQVYENTVPLPLGYAYDEVMSTDAYLALPVEDRLQVLTACAICDADALPSINFESAAVDLDYEITATEDVTLADHWIGAKDGGRMRIAFNAPEDCEVYILFDNMRVDLESTVSTEPAGFLVETEAGRAEANVPNRRNNFYFPKLGSALCIGHGGEQSCEVIFERDMNYWYDEIRMFAIPLDGYRQSVEARRREGMTDVALGKDALSGRIEVSGDRVLQIAVPYSDGWRAWVDGEEQDVFRCGGMYMGIAIGAGAHEIEMRYVTPGLKAGAMISAAAALLTVVLAVATAVNKRKERRAAR